MNPIDVAWQELGVSEVAGAGDNLRILEYQEHSEGVPDDDEIAWCSDFVGFCVAQAGLTPTGKANARSWLKWGHSTAVPTVGDIVVLWRVSPGDWRGHVGFYLGQNMDWVVLLGGNQGNKVCAREYAAHRVLDYRRRMT